MIGIDDGYHKKSGLAQYLQALHALDSLALIFWDGWTSDIATYWAGQDWMETFHDEEGRVSVSKLMISGCMPQTFNIAIGHMFNLHTMTKLSLMNCNISSFQDLFQETELRNLTHLKLDTDDCILPHEAESLQDFLQLNQDLEEVHFRFGGVGHVFSCLRPSWDSPPLTPRLKTISLTDPSCTEAWDFGQSFRALLENVCHRFLNLQQLGIQSRVLDSLRLATSAHMKDQFLLDFLVRIPY